MSAVVVDYGAGNLRSLIAALHRSGVESDVSRDAGAVAGATNVVLPGVGSAGSAMAALRRTGIDAALRDRFESSRPILGICLGMQLAVDATDEDGGVECLGLIEGRSVRLRGGRVPRMGWARVEPWGDAFYFAHSFVVESGATVATTEGIAAVIAERGFTGVQFHPEKSGRAGERFLQRCLSAA